MGLYGQKRSEIAQDLTAKHGSWAIYTGTEPAQLVYFRRGRVLASIRLGERMARDVITIILSVQVDGFELDNFVAALREAVNMFKLKVAADGSERGDGDITEWLQLT